MRYIDAYQLTNLGFARKLVATIVLLACVCFFAASWWSVSFMADLAGTRRAAADSFGGTLREIAWTAPGAYLAFFVAHFVSLGLSLIVGLLVFRRSAIRRKARTGLIAAAIGITMVDVAIWFTLPFLETSQALATTVSVIEAALLGLLFFIPFKQMWFYRRWSSKDGKLKRVVVVGGGFAGLDAVLGIDGVLGHAPDLEVVLVDRNNYFLFPPLLPSVAAGAIETRQVTYPFRRIFETTNVIFRKAEVVSINPDQRRLCARVSFDQDRQGNAAQKTSTLHYDYLVLAPGAEVNTFNTPGAEHAFMMRELADAIRIRNQVIDSFEQAAAASSRRRQRELLTFVICGAGPTGIEVATEIHDLIHHVLLKRYPEITPSTVSVKIVQSGGQILKGWHERVVETATKQLGSLNIDLLLGPRVTEVAPRHVTLNDGLQIPTRTVIWCAGVKPSPLLAASGLALDRSGRAIVDPDLRAEGYDNVFVLGDSCHFVDRATELPLPPLGQVAFQQAKQGAQNVVALLSGQKTAPFRYFNFGSLVSVGEHFAAVNLLGVRLSGFIGWFVWRTLYLMKLVGISNRLRVMLDWSLDLLIERSISQILAREKPEDSVRLAAEAGDLGPALEPCRCDSILVAAIAEDEDLQGEVREDEKGATGILVRKGPEVLSATIALGADQDGGSMVFTLEADLPRGCPHQVALARQEGLLALLRATNEVTVNDEQLDEMYIMDADESATSFLSTLREPLLTLGAVAPQIDIEGPVLRIRAEGITGDEALLSETVRAALTLWAQATEQLQKPAPVVTMS